MTSAATNPPDRAPESIAPGGRRRNRRGHGDRLREDLLAAAEAMVTGSGNAAVLSLRSVASRVGVAATSVYLHFADIDALKLALAQRGFEAFAAARDAVADDGDPARLLIGRCQAYARYALTHPGMYRLMFGPELPTLMTPAGTIAPSRDAFDSLTAAIARCQTAGIAPTHTAPPRLALLVWTGMHGQVILRTDRPYVAWPPAEQMVADLVTHLVGLDAAISTTTTGGSDAGT